MQLPSFVRTPPNVAELDRLGDEIAELSAHLDAATARFLDLVREFDTRAGWNNGFRSCAHWLSYRVGMDLGAAREKVRVAHALPGLPRIAQALASGELSYTKVRAVTRVASPETEERLLAVARAATASQLERIVRGWRHMDRKVEVQETEARHRSRTLSVYQDSDGMVVVRGRLTPEAGAALMRALDAASNRLFEHLRETPRTHPQADMPSAGQQQADALALVAESALRHDLDPGAPGERYQVVVHVDAAVLADADQPGQSVVADGARVSAETSQRLACDASRVVMRHDEDGNVVEIGARTRTIPPAIRRALLHRDPGCRFPGCGLRFVEGHHVHHWAQGGPTTLSNLAMLCRRHHRAIHEEGYQMRRRADGALEFLTPAGWPLPNVPPPVSVSRDPAGALRAVNIARGARIDGRTACATDGRGFNLGYAIDVLHPLANPLATGA